MNVNAYKIYKKHMQIYMKNKKFDHMQHNLNQYIFMNLILNNNLLIYNFLNIITIVIYQFILTCMKKIKNIIKYILIDNFL